MKKIFLYVLVIFGLLRGVGFAATLDGIYYDWSVFYIDNIGEEKKCYVVSFPKKSIGNFTKAREPYMLITRFKDKGVEEVSIYSGFEYKVGADMYVSVDGRQFRLFTNGDIAWSKNKIEDRDVIQAMLEGQVLKTRAESSRAEYVVDEYSLKGLSRAYKQMKELCKK